MNEFENAQLETARQLAENYRQRAEKDEVELAALRELLASIRETRHMGSFAVAGHVKAALDLCEEQLAALEKGE